MPDQGTDARPVVQTLKVIHSDFVTVFPYIPYTRCLARVVQSVEEARRESHRKS